MRRRPKVNKSFHTFLLRFRVIGSARWSDHLLAQILKQALRVAKADAAATVVLQRTAPCRLAAVVAEPEAEEISKVASLCCHSGLHRRWAQIARRQAMPP